VTDPAGPGAGSRLLVVEGVSVSFSGRQILDDVSFSVGAGQFTGLIGSNGAGKTTLMRVILGLERPGAGRVLVDGEPRNTKTTAIGYVPQKVALDPDMPIRARDLVALGIDGNRFGFPLPSRRRRDAVDQMLHAVSAESFADARVGTLSGGEQQRILIAQALIGSPRVLLLDEPLANLDLRSSQEVVTLLDRIADEHQIAILLSAHEMNPLLPVMDRVVYLAGGRAASGTVDEVVRDDVLSNLYGYEVHVHVLHGRVLVVAGPTETDAKDTGPPGTTLEAV
jgi:zinc/manganese transport system ATP-binding protein